MPFESLSLSNIPSRIVADQAHTAPTPIQSQTIPAVLNGGDLLTEAQTGIGGRIRTSHRPYRLEQRCSIAGLSTRNFTAEKHRAAAWPQTSRSSFTGRLYTANSRKSWSTDYPADAAINAEARIDRSMPSDHSTMTPPILVAPTGDNPC